MWQHDMPHLPALLSAARKSGVSTEFHGRSCQPWPLECSRYPLGPSPGAWHMLCLLMAWWPWHLPRTGGTWRHQGHSTLLDSWNAWIHVSQSSPILANHSNHSMNIQWFHTVSDLIFSSFTLFLLGLLKYSCGSLRDQAVQLVAYPTQRLIASPHQLVSVRPPTEFCPDNTRSDRQQSAARESMYRTSRNTRGEGLWMARGTPGN